MMGLGLGLGLAAVLAQAPTLSPEHEPPPDLQRPAPLPLQPRLDVRDSQRKAPTLPQVFGPEPPPELGGHHQKDDVTVTLAEDGTAKAHVPSPVRGTAGFCFLGKCLTTRGLRRGPKPERMIQYATAPILFGLAGAFGYAPASKNAAAQMLANTSQQRVQQRLDWTREQLERTRRQMGQRLAKLLHDHELTTAAKRAVVLELWTDALRTARAPVADGDDLGAVRAQGAAAIADTIEAFAHAHFPGLSPPPRRRAQRDVASHPMNGPMNATRDLTR